MKKHRKIIAVLLLTVLFFGFVSPVTTFTTEAAGYYPRIKEKNLTLQAMSFSLPYYFDAHIY